MISKLSLSIAINTKNPWNSKPSIQLNYSFKRVRCDKFDPFECSSTNQLNELRLYITMVIMYIHMCVISTKLDIKGQSIIRDVGINIVVICEWD